MHTSRMTAFAVICLADRPRIYGQAWHDHDLVTCVKIMLHAQSSGVQDPVPLSY